MTPQKKSRLIALAYIAFFIGFPVVGLLYFWDNAHNNIQFRAVDFVEQTKPLLIAEDHRAIAQESVHELALQIDDGTFDTVLKQIQGKTLGQPVAESSWASEEDDQIVQYCRLHLPVDGDPRMLEVVVRRKTVAPRWRYSEIKLIEPSAQK